MLEITLLCRVVDNFGDIGVAWRLCRALKREYELCTREVRLSLVVDNLLSFSRINSSVQPDKEIQSCDGILVYDWNAEAVCYEAFKSIGKNPSSVILECFQCGRPDWLERLLFDEELENTVWIIMIDYLTAEAYARTFHALPSLTRRARVQKVNFMPGFTEGTGGLIFGEGWLPEDESGRSYFEVGRSGAHMPPGRSILFFAYARGWLPLCRALERSCAGGKLNVLVAAGAGQESFLEACRQGGFTFSITELGFMNQEEWDSLLGSCSILFVRGEESLSRAVLSGLPFVWQAYPQSEDYQRVKVQALLDLMEDCFLQEDFAVVSGAWRVMNEAVELCDGKKAEELFFKFIDKACLLGYGFEEFSRRVKKNGSLEHNLMTFIDKKCIMS